MALKDGVMDARALLMIGLMVVVSGRAAGGVQEPYRGGATLPRVPSCRHGEDAQPADRARREQALDLARAILRAEAASWQRVGRYEPLSTLTIATPTPRGFEIRLYIDGPSFAVSVKDRSDPCRFGIFADHDGLLYEDSPRVVQMAR